jgi:hypothetical protein
VSLDTSVEIGVGETVTILADYRDPANLASHVGGKDCVTPVASTDYTGNTAADGTGSNITSDLDLSTTSFLGSRASIKAENNGTVTAYLRGPGSEDGMQIRGKGLYSGYQPIYSLAENSTSIASFGNRNLPSTMDLPLNSSQAVGAGAAEFLANLYGDIQNIPTKCRPLTEIPATLQACIVLDVGDKISISETQTAASAEVFINGVEGEVNGPTVRMTWTLAPASTVSVLILNDAVAGKLDSNALGYV